jgi:intracellular sulfur oxidation DsrE/DsrF family protein
MQFRTILAAFALVFALAAAPAFAQSPVKEHKLVLHVDDSDPARMNLALNNLSNVYDFYKKKGEAIRVELVAYGPGMHMFRADTSPVRSRLDQIKLAYDNVVYTACGNTIVNMEKAEGKEIKLVSDVTVAEAGVVRLIELQEQGWTYVRP